MPKFLFVYHGGGDDHPETEEEKARVMDEWGNWFGQMGEAVVDGGNPVGPSTTVHAGGKVESNGGSNPVSGYSLGGLPSLSLRAAIDDAIAKARGCPILKTSDGSVEVAEAFDM